MDWSIYLLLALLTPAVYSRVIHFDFPNYDDPDYATGNPHVRSFYCQAGLTVDVSDAFAAVGDGIP